MKSLYVLGVAAAMSMASLAHADELISNGGFETGDFTDWTTNTLGGSFGGISVSNLISGAPLPFSGFGAPGAAGGTYYASVDQNGAGGYEAYQSFTVAANATVSYSFDLFSLDYSGAAPLNPGYFGENGLTDEAAQYVRVDILDSMGAVLANLALEGSVGSYQNYSGDLSAVVAAGGTFTFRFRHFDNQFFYTTALDNVSLQSVVPLPTGVWLGGAGLLCLRFARRR
jgi:hypothetical protein